MELTVLIPTIGRDSFLAETLRDIFCQELGSNSFEVVVVDQNKIPVALRSPILNQFSRKSNVRWIECEAKGATYSRNKGISVSSGNILVSIDDDVRINDSNFLLKHLEAHLRSGPDVAAICGQELNPGATTETCELNYTRTSPMADILHFPRNYFKREEATVLAGANFSIKRKALIDVGCFDENFIGPAHSEDADLAMRLIQKGYRVVYDPSPSLFHIKAPMGGGRIVGHKISFSHYERVVPSVVFYYKYIHRNYPEYKWHYVYRYVLRRSLFLKSNILKPWREIFVFVALVRAFLKIERVVQRGPVCSFPMKY